MPDNSVVRLSYVPRKGCAYYEDFLGNRVLNLCPQYIKEEGRYICKCFHRMIERDSKGKPVKVSDCEKLFS